MTEDEEREVTAVAGLTSWRRLDELATTLEHQERLLRTVLDRLRADVDSTLEHWEGNTADKFRSHTGREHRQHHLEQAADRLHRAARLARQASQQNFERNHGVHTVVGSHECHCH